MEGEDSAHRESVVTAMREYRQHLVLSVRRPEKLLCGNLNAQERAFLRLLVEGETPLGIAEKRRMATRAMYNQLTALWKKLGVNSRRELLALVFALIEGERAAEAR